MVTYVNDLRLSELATGEGSGTWGATTNTNLELIGEALGYGTEQSFSSDADATTTIGDGVSDPARAMYFKVTSAGSLTATRTLTIAPNTVSRVMFIENATTGSQSIAISQGSGANVTIAAGKTAVVYLDGAGSGAAVVDAMAGVDPGVTDTLAEVLTAGNTTTTDQKIQFRDTGIYINSSADGQLDIVADTEIQIAATTIDIDGAVDMASTLAVGGNVTMQADDALLFIKESDGTNIAAVGDLTGSGQGGAFYYNHGGTAVIQLKSYEASQINSGIVFNEDSANVDFRVESSGNANALFVDADNNAVLVGKSTTALATAGLAFGTAGFASLTRDGAEPLNINRLSDDGKLAVFYKDGTEIGSLFTNGGAFVMKGNSASAPIQIQTVDGNEDIEVDPDGFIKMETAGSERLRINANGSVGIGVADGDVTGDGTAARTYVGIIGTANRGRLNLGSTASNGADAGTLAFTNGANTLADITVDTAPGAQTTGTMFINSTGNLDIRAAANYGVIINDGGVDADFRVESDADTHALFLQASDGFIGVGTASPLTKIHINNTSGGNYTAFLMSQLGNTSGHTTGLAFKFNSGGVSGGNISSSKDANAGSNLTFSTGSISNGADVQRLGISSLGGITATSVAGGHVVFNEDGVDADFRVESNDNENMLFVDGGANHVNIGTATDFGGVLNVNGGAVFDDATTFDPDTLGTGRIAIGQINDGGGFSAPGICWGGSGGQNAAVVSTAGTLYLGVGNRSGADNMESGIEVKQTEVSINNVGLETDFRVESDTISSAFFVDGATGISSFGQQVKCWLATAGQYTFTSQNSAGSTGMYLLNSNNQWSTTYNGGASTGDTVMTVGKDGTTSRSINAGGTINASGSDYAEYMVKANDFTATKGSILGIDATGKLTDVYSDAISFCVKTTDPSYVGGDTWSVSAGEKPAYDSPDYAAWESAYEAARATVDRIAFSGQVPVNVIGATVGDYIIPVQDEAGITGQAVSSPTFEQYMSAVGKVIAIEDDGRAKIIVKVA